MAIWKEQNAGKRDFTATDSTGSVGLETEALVESPPSHESRRRAPQREVSESLIAAGLVIEGTITGTGDVRIAGQFHGDVHVTGNLTIELGAKLTGGVRAGMVVIDGELEGNIDAASRVELRATAVLNGNIRAGSLTVAAGSRMRGQVEFGWESAEGADTDTQYAGMRVESASAA